jgi:hypothetical protein
VGAGLTYVDSVEILSGLSANDRIVIWGQNRLRGNEKLKIVPTDDDTDANAANTDA